MEESKAVLRGGGARWRPTAGAWDFVPRIVYDRVMVLCYEDDPKQSSEAIERHR